jgi:hypothetical protein
MAERVDERLLAPRRRRVPRDGEGAALEPHGAGQAGLPRHRPQHAVDDAAVDLRRAERGRGPAQDLDQVEGLIHAVAYRACRRAP